MSDNKEKKKSKKNKKCKIKCGQCEYYDKQFYYLTLYHLITHILIVLLNSIFLNR